jgi:type IV fimbrial biogenesis protein FimT
MKRSGGFTLIELLITVTVAAVLMGLAFPAFTNFIAGWRLTSQANELVAAIHSTRGEAIKRNRTVALCRAANDSATACAGGVSRWLHWIIAEGGNVVRRASPEAIGDSIRVSSTLANDTLSFGPNGLPNATATIVVCSTAPISDNRRVINVGPGNRVSMARETGNCP